MPDELESLSQRDGLKEDESYIIPPAHGLRKVPDQFGEIDSLDREAQQDDEDDFPTLENFSDDASDTRPPPS